MNTIQDAFSECRSVRLVVDQWDAENLNRDGEDVRWFFILLEVKLDRTSNEGSNQAFKTWILVYFNTDLELNLKVILKNWWNFHHLLKKIQVWYPSSPSVPGIPSPACILHITHFNLVSSPKIIPSGSFISRPRWLLRYVVLPGMWLLGMSSEEPLQHSACSPIAPLNKQQLKWLKWKNKS